MSAVVVSRVNQNGVQNILTILLAGSNHMFVSIVHLHSFYCIILIFISKEIIEKIKVCEKLQFFKFSEQNCFFYIIFQSCEKGRMYFDTYRCFMNSDKSNVSGNSKRSLNLTELSVIGSY